MNRFSGRRGIACTALLLAPLLAPAAAGQETTEKKSPAQQEDAAASGKTEQSKPETHTVKSERFKIEVKLTGSFEAGKTWPIVLRPKSWSSFPVIRAVPHGKRVTKGERLVWLDTEPIDQKLDDAEAELKKSALDLNLAQLNQKLAESSAKLDLEAAKRSRRIAAEDLEYYHKVGHPQQLESAAFSLKSSQQSLEYATEELKQLEKMYGADDLTEETEEIVLKRARNDVERSKFYLKSAEIRNERTLKQEIPRQEQQIVDAAQRAEIEWKRADQSASLQLQKQKIELAQKEVAYQRAEQSLEKLRHDRQLMEIVAPADGYVYYGQCKRGKWSGVDAVSSQLRPGGKLVAQSVFMTVVAPRPLHIRLEVPEKQLRYLSPKIKGIARPTGFPDLELATTLDQLGAFPISSGTFDARAIPQLADNARAIVPGMTCETTWIAYDQRQAITVPPSAVFENDTDGRRNLVYRVDAQGKPKPVRLKLGKKTDKRWEVLAGLKKGDQILLTRPDEKK